MLITATERILVRSTLRSSRYTQNRFLVEQCHYYIYKTADSEHCFDLSGFISAVDVSDVYSRQYMSEKEFFACVCDCSGC